MSIAATIREKLMIALRPTRLDVINESHVHAGHQSSPGTGESHFRVLVMSPEFAGKSRVDRLSFPKIRSGRIRAVRENQTIIQCDGCDHLPAWNIYRRSAQVAAPA
jgi:acid stress-induced BolA-like protein IbaG/YrbA